MSTELVILLVIGIISLLCWLEYQFPGSCRGVGDAFGDAIGSIDWSSDSDSGSDSSSDD